MFKDELINRKTQNTHLGTKMVKLANIYKIKFGYFECRCLEPHLYIKWNLLSKIKKKYAKS